MDKQKNMEKKEPCKWYPVEGSETRTFTERDFVITGLIFATPIIGQIYWVVSLLWYLLFYKNKRCQQLRGKNKA